MRLKVSFAVLGGVLAALTPSGAGQQICDSCLPKIVRDDSSSINNKYTIGVLGIRGEETAYSQYSSTFGRYLTSTAGQRFDPPVEFEMVYLDFQKMYDWTRDKVIDFTFVSPSPSACLEAEYGVQSLASYTSKAVLDGTSYKLSEFAGLIIARADNSDVNSIVDLKDKVVGAVSIAGFGAALLQFHEMQKAGLSYINDPKKIVFTKNQGLIVKGVLNGDFDVGFVRTGLMEKTKDDDGNPIDKSLLKILQPRQQESDGQSFPYVHSTPLYPEWNLASLRHVSSIVTTELQAALLALAYHAETGNQLDACLQQATANTTGIDCQDLQQVHPQKRCDTTLEVAQAATTALSDAGNAGWRTTLSYNNVRGLLQDTGFIQQDENNTWQCTRPAGLYDSIVCPPGHFKKSETAFDESCDNCPEEFQCACKPCFQAEAMEVAPLKVYKPGSGCPKMSICGTFAQQELLVFKVVDNTQQEGEPLLLQINVLEGSAEAIQLMAEPIPDEPHAYQFTITGNHVGILILEILSQGEQISASPLRVQVTERICDEERRVADDEGNCVCDNVNTFSIGDSCVPKWLLFTAIFVPLGCLGAVAIMLYIRKKRREADSLWLVNPNELKFSDPPQVVGRGSFGLVLLAEYRGARVAVKRVLPPKKDKSKSNKKSSSNPNKKNPAVMFDMPAADQLKDEVENTNGSMEIETDRPGNARRLSLSSSGESIVVDITAELEEFDVEANKSERSNLDSSSGGGIDLNSSAGGFSMLSMSTSSVESPDHMLNNGDAVKKKMGSSTKRTSVEGSKRMAAMKKEFIEEMRMLSKLRHPNITTIMGAVIQRKKDPMLIMEYMEHGSLYEVLHNPTMELEPELVLHIMKDLAQGVRFLHSSNPPVIHGDLKSGNILIDSKFRAKLSDFGLSKNAPEKATGTPLWMAPELLRGETTNTTMSDMYSVGIILYELYSRKDPYEDSSETDQELIRKICDKKKGKRPTIPPGCPSKVKQLMKFLWHAKPDLRHDAKELDSHLVELEAKDVGGSVKMSHRTPRQKQEQDQESFLYQAFPRHVADVLKRGGKVEPEQHEIVTIFFSDIVGFTTIASTFDPLKVSNLLDRLYLKFDSLARKHELFKIETIGDAYMCAGNLATDQSNDHVKRVAEFSNDAIKAAVDTLIDEDDPSRGAVMIRVGFHSGPVVSNVVGSLNPRYGLFGDTVNVSSRMESTSEKGRIHCSKRSAEILMKQAPELPVKLRGETPVKGKGTMTTYWVN